MKIIVKNVKNGVLETQFGNSNLKDNSVSFPIKWSKVKNAKSYAITLIDKEASKSLGVPFIHWIAANIKKNRVDWDFSFQNKDKIIQFENSMSAFAKKHLLEQIVSIENNGVYVGPFPVESDHNYELRIYALNTEEILKNSNFNKEDKLFFDDFQNLIKGKVIDSGFYTFLYRTKYVFINDRFVENNKESQELNKGLEKDKIFFYKGNKKTNIEIKSSAFYRENNEIFLNKFYVAQKHNNLFHSISLPLEFSKINEAKSYVVTLLGNAEVKNYATPLIFWIRTELENENVNLETDNFIKIPSRIINQFNINKEQKYHYINTFGTHLAQRIASDFGESDEIFRYIANDYGLVKIPNISDSNGIYTLTIYALDEKINFVKRENFDVISLGDVLESIKSHVVGEGNIQFKIK
ncbi:YbhB/YbcL family Raf kinase inhibitor-like protein [Mycoplasma sp. 1012]